MNYRHIFHAGNFADVLKHLVLTHVITHMTQKPAPIRIIDTHAGAGLYDLTSPEAARTGEWRDGIGKLIGHTMPPDVEAVLKPFLDLLAGDFNVDGGLLRYPGSPLVARRLMRSQDVLIANELHPVDRDSLADVFHRDRQTKIMGLDGYIALKSLLPPKERRGVVLVDPPFEVPGEFERLAGAVIEAHRRFATGTLILWYPVKDQAAVAAFHARLANAALAKTLAVELAIADPAALNGRLAATGLVIVNPPYRLAEQLQIALPFLAEALAVDGKGGFKMNWIIDEATAARAAKPISGEG